VKIIWWGYGMTEIYAMPMIDPAEQDVPRGMDTIGMPPKWLDYGVVDEHDQLVGPGELGELVWRPRMPHSMVAEYYKDPERTLETFRNLMFHTGDIALYDEDGVLHYRGRTGERIRRRGENIAAPELEWVALQHECVLEAAAYGVPSELGEEEVKLDVLLKTPISAGDLHAWLGANLPRYMIPRYLEIREEFPKTASERIQKYLLKDQPLDRPEVFDAETR
jgi:crotonobetaine/carnitine-CoA ligase